MNNEKKLSEMIRQGDENEQHFGIITGYRIFGIVCISKMGLFQTEITPYPLNSTNSPFIRTPFKKTQFCGF